MNISKDRKPILKITQLAWDKIWGLTFHHKTEVSCLGLMPAFEPSKLTDVVNVKQTCSASNTKMDADWLNQLYLEYEKKGVSFSQWGSWIHTHNDMDVFWSATDEATIQALMHARKMVRPKEGVTVNGQWPQLLWSIVTNRKGNYKIRCDMIDPFRYSWDDCDYELVEEVNLCPDEFLKESAELVEKEVYVKRYPTYYRGGTKSNINWGRTFTTKVEKESDKVAKRLEIEFDLLSEKKTPAEKKTEVEHLSNQRLQQMFDAGVISVTEALELEKEYLCTKAAAEGKNKRARKKANREAEAQLNEKLDWYLCLHNEDNETTESSDEADSDWDLLQSAGMAAIEETGYVYTPSNNDETREIDANMIDFWGELEH